MINYINTVVFTFEITSQLFYFYKKIFHMGAIFETSEQESVKTIL